MEKLASSCCSSSWPLGGKSFTFYLFLISLLLAFPTSEGSWYLPRTYGAKRRLSASATIGGESVISSHPHDGPGPSVELNTLATTADDAPTTPPPATSAPTDSSVAPTEAPAALNDSAMDIWWCHYPGIFMVFFGFILSPVCAYQMYKRRNMFPFSKLNMKVIIAQELLTPFTVWHAALPITTGGESVPCWVSLLFWDIPLVPTMFIILYLIYKLWLDSRYSREVLVGNTSSFFVVHYQLLSSYKVIGPAAAVSWAYTWLGVLPRAARTWGHWNKSLLSAECNNFQDIDTPLGISTSISFNLIIAAAALFLLKDVKEAFNMKGRFIKASLVMLVGFVFVDSIPISFSLIGPKSFTPVYGLSILVFSFANHSVTWLISVSALYDSYRYENEKAISFEGDGSGGGTLSLGPGGTVLQPVPDAGRRTSGGAMIITHEQQLTELKSVSSPDDLRQLLLNREMVIEAFMEYLVQELCVENIAFIKMTDKARKAPTDEEREQTSAKIMELFIVPNSVMEINISASLRRQLVSLYQDCRGKPPPDFWDPATMEIYKLLMDPFQRFYRKTVQRAIAQQQASGGTVAKKIASIRPTR